MTNLDFSRGVMIETHRFINSIDTAQLQQQWQQISDTASSWWEQLQAWLQKLWLWLKALLAAA
jgi:hypothetical protein